VDIAPPYLPRLAEGDIGMSAFQYLSRFGSTVKGHTSPIWMSAAVQFGVQWLTRRRRPVALVIIACSLLVWSLPYWPPAWRAYKTEPAIFVPFFTPIGALLVGLAAFGQWRTARLRHEEQTRADRQRRITESFSKAVEQLGSDKLEVRVGGIYSLERISKESPDDYWTVMENLTAFVRERSRRNEAERTSEDVEQRVSRRAYILWREAGRPDGRSEEFWAEAVRQHELGKPPATDIDAVLTVIKRRNEQSRKREDINGWRLDLSGAVLTGANLMGAHLEGANLHSAHLQFANLSEAHLEGASLWRAHFDNADLYLADLQGTDLSDALGLPQAQFLLYAYGDAKTQLPRGLARPALWPAAEIWTVDSDEEDNMTVPPNV
jgi:hypothetical protein